MSALKKNVEAEEEDEELKIFHKYLLSDEDMEIVKNLPNAQEKFDICISFYEQLWRERNFEKAEYYNELSYSIKKEMMFPSTEEKETSFYFFNKANIYSAQNMFEKSIPMYEKTLNLMLNCLGSIGKTEFIINIYKNLAFCYNAIGNKEQAIANLQSAY